MLKKERLIKPTQRIILGLCFLMMDADVTDEEDHSSARAQSSFSLSTQLCVINSS